MNSFNDLSPSGPSSSYRDGGTLSQVELQERILAELSQPVQTIPQRIRKPLSKFTISNPVPYGGGDGERFIPAHRAKAHESLPVLSPEDIKRMNISPYTGMSLCDYHSSHPTPSNSRNSFRSRKQLRLQRKTIHRSLEDLRGAGNHSLSSDHISPVPLSPSLKKASSSKRHSSGKASYPLEQDSSFVKTGNPICPSLADLPPHYPHQSINFDVQRNNIINTSGASTSDENSSSDGRSEDFNSITPITTAGGETDSSCIVNDQREAVIDKSEIESFIDLSQENSSLKKEIQMEKRKCALYRFATTFIFLSLRRKSLQLIEIEQRLLERREECAARVVLHHLLLNSWRMTKAQAGVISMENMQMHKTIDNQSLQLNVIRKMQLMEKERTSSVLKDYAEVERKFSQTMMENEAIKVEYGKVLEEKTTLERHLRSLRDENLRLNTDLRIRLDKRDMQLKSMELDRLQAEKFSKEKERLVKETELAKTQIKELVVQRSQWQDKAVSLESKCFELKLELESKGKTYEKVLYEKQEISKENESLTVSKSKLEKDVEQSQAKLLETAVHRKNLESSYDKCKTELKELEVNVECYKDALLKYKRENEEMREKLYKLSTRNVYRRRVWGAALYFLASPIEAFKRFYYGTPERPRKSQGIQPASPPDQPNHDISGVRISDSEKVSVCDANVQQ